MAERITQLLQNGQFSDVAPALDAAELALPHPDFPEGWPLATHLLAHVYNHNLPDARFLWKRVPEASKRNNPELEAVWKLLQFSWNQHYEGVWEALQGYPWSPALQPMVDALAEKLRHEMLELVEAVYATIPPAKLAALCGLSEQAALAVGQGAGWQLDGVNAMLQVVPRLAPKGQKSGLADLQQLSEYIVHLEA